MRRLLSLSLLLAAPAAAAEPADDSPPIVITGKSVQETERALASCLARKCPPDEDIDASLAHAENLFVAGAYKAARRTARASIGRNRRHAKAYPVPVADLYRADSRIAAHLGEGRSYEWSTAAVKRSLKAGLPREDIRLIAAELEKAAMYASLGRTERARQIYAAVQRDARSLGRDDIAAHARLRSAWLHQLEGNTNFARAALQEIVEDRSPAARVPRAAALVVLARLDRLEGKTVSSQALIEELRSLGGDKPVLLFSPPIKPPGHGVGRLNGAAAGRAIEAFEKQWVDIGFRIGPEGRVSDAEMLRSQGSTRWAEPVLRAIAGRVYSPVKGGEGQYRVERYSLTSLWDYNAKATHLRQRSAQARIEMLDLTAEPEPVAR